MAGPLQGLNVLSLGRVLSGPYAAMLLADLGAEVIKIEDRSKGDMSRATGPFINGVGSYFLSINRGKKSLALNLRSEEGKDIIRRLLPRMDVLIENFRPGVTAKMGLDYDSVKEINPALVYLSISGFGQTGPQAARPAYDMIAQAMGGTISITGEEGRPPVRTGFSIGDIGAALYGANALLAALYERQSSGLGQHIDIAMVDCQAALCENALARHFATGEIPRPIGTRHPVISPFQIFPTATENMVVIAASQKDWQKLCQVLDRRDWLEDPDFADSNTRTANQAKLEALLTDIFRQKPRDEWLALFTKAGVAAGPVLNIGQVAENEQLNLRQMFLEVNHARAGKLKVVGTPMKFSRTPCRINQASPVLGQHSAEILTARLNLTAEAISRLKEEEII